MDLPISDAINEINRHITVLNDDYTAISVDVGILKSQMEMVVWFFRIIIAGFIGIIITQFWQIMLINKKNNRKDCL